jgi:hypothetical protein
MQALHTDRGMAVTLNHLGAEQVAPTPRMPGVTISPKSKGHAEPENYPPSSNGSFNDSGSFAGDGGQNSSAAAPPPPSFGDATAGVTPQSSCQRTV